jgi:hypothetical protein
MPLPIFGSARAAVLDVASVSLHGDIYHDVLVTLNDDPTPHRIRLASHICTRPPQPGDSLELTFLMQQVNGVRFIA